VAVVEAEHGVAQRSVERAVSPGAVFVLVVVALCLVRVGAAASLASNPSTFSRSNGVTADLQRWHEVTTSPGRPYRDVQIEYPPVTWGAAKLIDSDSLHTSGVRLIWSQLVLDLLTAAGLAYGWGRRAALAYLLLGLVFVVWPFVYLRLDLLPVMLVVWGLALARRRFGIAGGALIGLACFAKLWPLAVIPGLAVARRWRALGSALTVGVVGLVAWVAWGTTKGVRDVITFRGAKGWQIESVGGAIVRAVGSSPVHVEAGAWRVSAISPFSRDLLAVALVAALATLWWLLERVRAAGPGLSDGVAPLAAVAAVLVFSPIISPQYAVWLLPFAALAAAYRHWTVAGVATVACALSTELMHEYGRVALGSQWIEVVLMLRNGLLIALVGLGGWQLWRARGTGTPSATADSV
jgi:Glycosyltransferase family 87